MEQAPPAVPEPVKTPMPKDAADGGKPDRLAPPERAAPPAVPKPDPVLPAPPAAMAPPAPSAVPAPVQTNGSKPASGLPARVAQASATQPVPRPLSAFSRGAGNGVGQPAPANASVQPAAAEARTPLQTPSAVLPDAYLPGRGSVRR